ncbi:MAG: prolyl oligopeptidase family serine peptidase [Clostridia bacterium]|nr:prolyl oligopeptidase family serine peptidase [Clostridia bacterium]
MMDCNSEFRKCLYTGPDGYTMPYRLYIPKNYDCGERYPLVLYLHGAGNRGTDNEKHLYPISLWFKNENNPVYNAIVVAPQCPEDKQWVNSEWQPGVYSVDSVPESEEIKAVLAILERVMEFCNVDEDRVYVTGESMGGYGTWDLLTRHGSRFAAGVPVCGGVDVSKASLLKRIPVWLFHGSADTTVLPEGSRLIFAEIRKAGGEEIRYTEYNGVNHNAWDFANLDTEMHEWLFRQSRLERRLLAEKKARKKKTAIIAGSGAGALFLSIAAVFLVRRNRKNRNTEN